MLKRKMYYSLVSWSKGSYKSFPLIAGERQVGKTDRIRRGEHNVDDNGIDNYPLFVCGFMRCLFQDPKVNLDYDISDVLENIGV